MTSNLPVELPVEPATTPVPKANPKLPGSGAVGSADTSADPTVWSPDDADSRSSPLRDVTIRDVANAAGVAISSVSRVLSNHPHVSNDLRARVKAAVQQLGYRPNHVAHSLRRGDTLSVGFLVGNISNPIIADISAGASTVLAAAGYATLLVCSHNDPTADLDYLHVLAQRRVSGFILSTAANGPDDGQRELITRLGIPAIMLDRRAPHAPFAGVVRSDHNGGVAAAVRHLAMQGHRRIALVGGPGYFEPAAERLAGYHRGFQEAGLEFDPALVHSLTEMGRRVAHAATHELLDLDAPTAIIAGGNLILAGVLQALKEREIAIGQRIALVGCDDTDLTQLHTPSITVIARDLRELGRVAARALLQAIEEGSAPTITLPTRLEVRKSSCCPPAVPA